jgi:hypothetical protein
VAQAILPVLLVLNCGVVAKFKDEAGRTGKIAYATKANFVAVRKSFLVSFHVVGNFLSLVCCG